MKPAYNKFYYNLSRLNYFLDDASPTWIAMTVIGGPPAQGFPLIKKRGRIPFF